MAFDIVAALAAAGGMVSIRLGLIAFGCILLACAGTIQLVVFYISKDIATIAGYPSVEQALSGMSFVEVHDWRVLVGWFGIAAGVGIALLHDSSSK